jgi:DNA-binding NarL/FixJ family response regulator
MYRILVVDDHVVVRHGLVQLLAEAHHDAVIGQACCGQETLDLARNQDWDVVVLDICLPDKSGLQVLKELKKMRPNLPVLVLTMYEEDLYAHRMLKAGAKGYLTKRSAGTEIVRALQKVRNGGLYVSDSLGEKLSLEGKLAVHEESLHARLSDREFDVLTMIASGKTVTEIARNMSLSVKTVSTYRVRILAKMNMRTNAELTHYAISNRLVN